MNPNVFTYNQFLDIADPEHVEMCKVAYEMIKSIYSKKRIDAATQKDNSITPEFTARMLEDQDAVIEYVLQCVDECHPTDAVIITHLLFGMYISLSDPRTHDKHTYGVIEDCVLMLLRKYNKNENDYE